MKRRSKSKSVKRRKLPECWIDTITDMNQYKLTTEETQQRKAAYVSKHKEAAREEWLKKQEEIKQGKIPKEIQEIIAPPKKKYTSNSAHISKDPKNSNNRPMTSLQRHTPVAFSGTPTLNPSYTTIRTTYRPATSSVISTLKQSESSDLYSHAYNTGYSPTIQYDPSAFSDLKSLDRLDSAMHQLESAMTKAIEYSPDYINRTYTYHEEADRSEISDSSIFTYSPEGQATPVRDYSPQQTRFQSILEEYKENTPPPLSSPRYEAYTPETKQESAYNAYLIEPKTNSKFDINSIKGYTLENTFGKVDTGSFSPLDSEPVYKDWTSSHTHSENSKPARDTEDGLTDMKFSNIYSKFLTNTSEYIESSKPSRSIMESEDATSSHADYLAHLLEQTRKDLEYMKVPSYPTFEFRSTDAKQDLLKQIPSELHQNYDEDLISAQYSLKPIPKFSSGPIIRGKVPMSSLALVDSVKRMPSFRTNM